MAFTAQSSRVLHIITRISKAKAFMASALACFSTHDTKYYSLLCFSYTFLTSTAAFKFTSQSLYPFSNRRQSPVCFFSYNKPLILRSPSLLRFSAAIYRLSCNSRSNKNSTGKRKDSSRLSETSARAEASGRAASRASFEEALV